MPLIKDETDFEITRIDFTYLWIIFEDTFYILQDAIHFWTSDFTYENYSNHDCLQS